MKLKLGAALASLILSGFLSKAQALEHPDQDLTEIPFETLLQQEVISASKLARQVSDAPSAVSIVTAEEIRAFGYRTLAEVIQAFPGLYTTFDQNYHFMGGRGFGDNAGSDYAGRIMLLIDGYATQDNVFGQIYLGEDGLLDVDLIERVEYVPGTGAVSYGNNAMLGIINVITKQGSAFNGTRISGRLGSHGETRKSIIHGKQFDNGLDLLLSFSNYQNKGHNPQTFHEFAALGNTLGQEMVKPFDTPNEKNQRFFGKATFENLMVEFGFSNRTKDLPFAYYSYTAPSLETQSADKNAFINTRVDHDISSTTKSSTRIYVGSYENRDRINFITSKTLELDGDAYADQWGSRKNLHTGTWLGLDQKFVNTAFTGHTLVSGFEARSDIKQDYVRSYYLTDGSRVNLSPNKYALRHQRDTLSYYLEDSIFLSRDLTMVAGLREDIASDGFNASSPRFALIYTLSPSTTLKGSKSAGFKFPNAYDLYGAYKAGYAAQIQRVAADEIVLLHNLSANQQISLTAYQYRLTNLETDTGFDGHARTAGFEFVFHGKNPQRKSIYSLSASYQKAKDSSGQQLPNSPNTILKGRYSEPFLPGLRAGVETLYFSDRTGYDQNRIDSYALTHLTLSTERKNQFNYTLGLLNVFDKKYLIPTYLPGTDLTAGSGLTATDFEVRRPSTLPAEGRTFWVQLSYDF